VKWGVSLSPVIVNTICKGKAITPDVIIRATRVPVAGRVLGMGESGATLPLSGVFVTVSHYSFPGGSVRLRTDGSGHFATSIGVDIGTVVTAGISAADAADAGIAAFSPSSRLPFTPWNWLLAGGSYNEDVAVVSALVSPAAVAVVPDIVASRYALCATVDLSGVGTAPELVTRVRTLRLFKWLQQRNSTASFGSKGAKGEAEKALLHLSDLRAGDATAALPLSATVAEAAISAKASLGLVFTDGASRACWPGGVPPGRYVLEAGVFVREVLLGFTSTPPAYLVQAGPPLPREERDDVRKGDTEASRGAAAAADGAEGGRRLLFRVNAPYVAGRVTLLPPLQPGAAGMNVADGEAEASPPPLPLVVRVLVQVGRKVDRGA
jgi:hypothetical protein